MWGASGPSISTSGPVPINLHEALRAQATVQWTPTVGRLGRRSGARTPTRLSSGMQVVWAMEQRILSYQYSPRVTGRMVTALESSVLRRSLRGGSGDASGFFFGGGGYGLWASPPEPPRPYRAAV